MKKCFTTALVLILTGPAFCAPMDVPQTASPRVSLNANAMEIRDALRALETQAAVRIMSGNNVQGKVTVSLQSVPLETALRAITGVSGNHWTRLVLPVEKAKRLTSNEASALAKAAETLAGMALTVQNSGASPVHVGGPDVVQKDTATVYFVDAPETAIKADREPQVKEEPVPPSALSWKLSDDAKQDTSIVRTLSQIQNLSPDQVAVVAREFIRNMTPQQMQEVGEAMRRQAPRFRTE